MEDHLSLKFQVWAPAQLGALQGWRRRIGDKGQAQDRGRHRAGAGTGQGLGGSLGASSLPKLGTCGCPGGTFWASRLPEAKFHKMKGRRGAVWLYLTSSALGCNLGDV